MLTSLCVCTYERTNHLTAVFQGIAKYARQPYEVIVVDDCSKNPDVAKLISHFQAKFHEINIPFTAVYNKKNLKHAASQNKAWRVARGDILFHIEDDIVIPHDGFNLKFAKFFQDHPEVGQVVPQGTGRGEWIPRGPYDEFAWALGGFFAVRREVYEDVGGWDESLVHQVEPDYNLRVRMGGWRVAEIPGIRMVHLGEGEEHETFRRQAQISIGVHSMLKKWNRRFMGVWDYDSLWSMSWDDFPPNEAFRRMLAAWYVAEAKKLEDRYRGLGVGKNEPNMVNAVPSEVRKAHGGMITCRGSVKPFKYPGHWGAYEKVDRIRPIGREREDELVDLMKNNHVFRDVDKLPQSIRNLAQRMKYNLTEEELQKMLAERPKDYRWEAMPVLYGNQHG
jgi:GT2 family glycosyltransferase